MNGESTMETYTLTYGEQTAISNLLFDSENSNWGSMTTQVGWEVEGRLKKQGTYVPMTDPC